MDDRLPEDSSPAKSSAEVSAGHDPLEGVTSAGMIVTGADRGRIPVDFKPVIDNAVERLGSFEGAHSLYVYGSVATGTARVGYSDVDLVTVGLDAATSRRLGETLSADFPKLCRSVEVGAAQPSAYRGSDDKAYGNRVFLRHYCVHLAGLDIRDGLPDFPADRAAARGFNGDIGLYADRWRTELLRSADPGSLARRIARKTLLAVSGLVSIHYSIWTTDRVAAARRWGVVVPRLASSLDTLLAWSSEESTRRSRTEVQNVLDGVVADVVDDFAGQIGLWNRPGSR